MKNQCLFLVLVALGSFFTPLFSQNNNIELRSKMTFPGQTLANICGYAADGHEYALCGGSKGMIIVDVTDPDNPIQIVQIPGVDDLWKEIKVYGHYAYVTSEGTYPDGKGDGLQIVDLSNLPGNNLAYHHYSGDGPIVNSLQTIHALHIDEKKGFVYLYGSNIGNKGAIVLDLNADPYNPTYAGEFQALGYVHDGYVDNDTLYAGHIYSGLFSVVNMADKSNPQIINTQGTPNAFTHNTWISTDRKIIFATDETENSYLSSWDVSDPTDIKFLDKVQSNPGLNSAVHNTHVLGDYAITSWYTDGVTIVDATKADNLVQVGNYDTYPQGQGPGFVGCWGVYPYLPSGTMVASNMTVPDVAPGELYVLSPTYVRACYLEGKISDATTGLPLSNAKITINSGDPNAVATSEGNGSYRNGQAASGAFTVTISRFGYEPQTLPISLSNGETTLLDVALEQADIVTISGLVVRASDGQPVPNAFVKVLSADIEYQAQTNSDGTYILTDVFAGTYNIVAGAWGFLHKVIPSQNLSGPIAYTIELEKGYQDDFLFDLGWVASGSSTTGVWERGEPKGVDVGILLAPELDQEDDLGNACFVTGNGTENVDEDDVESGTSILLSPSMKLDDYQDPILNFALWCTSFDITQQSVDSIKVYLVSGTQETLIEAFPGDLPDWRYVSIHAKNFLPLSADMRLKIVCFDNPSGFLFDSYEAALDAFLVEEGNASGTDYFQSPISIAILPNPFAEATRIVWSQNTGDMRLRILDVAGRCVEEHRIKEASGVLHLGAGLPAGAFTVSIEQSGRVVKTQKMVKVNP